MGRYGQRSFWRTGTENKAGLGRSSEVTWKAVVVTQLVVNGSEVPRPPWPPVTVPTGGSEELAHCAHQVLQIWVYLLSCVLDPSLLFVSLCSCVATTC